MKRSTIDAEIDAVRALLAARNFHLPPFASWSPDDWRRAGHDYERARANRLGWDVTDFGRGDFDRCGAVLFTIRNGRPGVPGSGTPYAEKIIVLKPGQCLPLHFHWTKTEDIINRGGGLLVLDLFNARDDDGADRESPVSVYCDGRRITMPAGGRLSLRPGESVTLTPRLYHLFLAEACEDRLLCGEVSSVNDDDTDNRFAEPAGRFSEIEEDALPRYVLCNEYGRPRTPAEPA